MGVPGLWDLLRPAATRTSLSTLAKEAFYANKNGQRALTIGIDASIWIFHAQIPQYGENPFLRTIFFKITSLLQQPVLPVFVFDGPNKPSRKRGERVAGHFGTSDYRSKQFKELLDACGLEWWNAPGEAEAELAVMSRQGKIDAVLSDDVDALLFGATCLLRNNSPTLSGAQASSTQANSSKSDLRHYEMYRSSAIVKQWTERENTTLKTEEDVRMAMVWIALLGGGDYAPEGLPGFGPTITYALANAGMADFLHRHKAGSPIDRRDAQRVISLMTEELRTNKTGHLGRRYPDRANKLAAVDPASIFPTSSLDAYLRPATSASHEGWPGFGKGESLFQKRGKARNEGRGDVTGFAKACERFFEWGTKDLVAKKFASESVGLFGSELVTCARERVRLRDPPQPAAKRVSDETRSPSPATRITGYFQSTAGPSRRTTPRRQSFTGLPSHVLKIHAVRKDPTNPDLNEYRISFATSAYIARCHGEMDGHRVDPKELDVDARAGLGLVDKDLDEPTASQAVGEDGARPAPAQAKTEARIWMAEYLVKEAWPELIDAYEAELAAKAKRKPRSQKVTSASQKKTTGKASGVDTEAFKLFFLPTQRAATQTVYQAERSSSPLTDLDDEQQASAEHLPPHSTTTARHSSPSSSRSSTLTPPPPLRVPKPNARRAATPSSSASSSSRPPPSTQARRSPARPTGEKPPSPRRGVRRSIRGFQKSKMAIIDLCSSSEDDAPAPAPATATASRSKETTPRPALAALDQESNTPPRQAQSVCATQSRAPAKSKSPDKGKGKGKSKEKQSASQTLLALPVVRPTTAPPAKNVSKPDKAPLFVVTYEDDQAVEIDVRGRWARGESVGIWEDVTE